MFEKLSFVTVSKIRLVSGISGKAVAQQYQPNVESLSTKAIK